MATARTRGLNDNHGQWAGRVDESIRIGTAVPWALDDCVIDVFTASACGDIRVEVDEQRNSAGVGSCTVIAIHVGDCDDRASGGAVVVCAGGFIRSRIRSDTVIRRRLARVASAGRSANRAGLSVTGGRRWVRTR